MSATMGAEARRLILAMLNAHNRLRTRGVEAPIRFCVTEAQLAVLVEANALSTTATGPAFRRSPVVAYDFGGYAFCTESGLREEIKP